MSDEGTLTISEEATTVVAGEPQTETVPENPYDGPETVSESPPPPAAEETTTATPEPAAEPASTDSPAPTEEPGEFDASLIQEAQSKGFSESDIKSFGDEAGMRAALTAFDRRMSEIGQQQPQYQQPQAPYGPQPPQQPQQPQAPQQPQVDPAQAFKPFELKLDPETVDENVLSQLTAMNQHYADQSVAMQQAIGSLVNSHQQQAFENEVSQLDNFIKSLGDEYVELFGKGSTRDMNAQSDQFQNRSRLYDSAKTIESGYMKQNMRAPSLNGLLKGGLRLGFGDKVETIARRGVTNRVNKARATQSHPPTRREGRPVKPGTDEAVYEAAAKVFQEKDIPDIPKLEE